MPEGDTVLLTARRLDAALTGHVLTRALLQWPRVPVGDLVGARVLGTRAYGKHILTSFDDGRTLHTHLRMDGSWRVARTGSREAAARGDFVRAVLAHETWTCIGNRLGMLDLVPTSREHELIGHLGPDILADDFDAHLPGVLTQVSTDPVLAATDIGELLLDQRVVAGIGTLFAAEGLFALRIWPWTPAGEVDLATLLLSARGNLRRGVLRPVDGRRVHVHARSGQPCHRCGTTLLRGTVRRPPTERPMFYCPACQVPPSTPAG